MTFLVLHSSEYWGFYGHRMINRMAVYTLPPEMMYLYKPHIDFITEHAVDPDKRRYASNFEASRHYIDLDHWGFSPFDSLPRVWSDALLRFCDVIWISTTGDSLFFYGDENWKRYFTEDSLEYSNQNMLLRQRDFPEFFSRFILTGYYEDSWEVDCALWRTYLGLTDTVPCEKVVIRDHLTEHGILPYHLKFMQSRLTKAFLEKDRSRIIRLSAEIGHYIGDAHVPLHTTSNYNGQLTDQLGIHAFWESRIPELFAEEQYDFFVGKAEYISDPQSFFWNMVMESNSYVDSVLLIEKELSTVFPSDQQYCFDDRLNITVRTQCEAYARAYQDRMQGLVEKRMRASIKAIGSSWYTAWVDAGQPDFRRNSQVINDLTEAEEDLIENHSKRIKGRVHE
ncbi:MAG: hypothetical protein KDC53_21210 [Saprospiraceae bacterium]|nr:hypothetical protein [Saprospiraceae bacterium]